MSGVENYFARGSESIASVFGWKKSSSSKVAGLFGTPSPYKSPTLGPPPTTDTAANNSQQQQQQLARQKGVLATIFAGNNATAPVTSKTQLGA